MKKSILLNFSLIICLGLAAQNPNVDIASILTPRSHNPAFVEPGGTIVVELRDSLVTSHSGWKSELWNDLSKWTTVVKSVAQEKIHHGTENGSRIEVVIPKDTPPELMELVIYSPSGVKYSSPRAVSIVPDFEEDFYIIHQSDEHVTISEAVEPGGKSSIKWGNGSKEALEWLTPVLNIINPRFVLHTGDNTQLYHEPDQWVGIHEGKNRMERFIVGISGYRVPTVLIPGNHDMGFPDYVENIEWRKVYHKIIGQSAFSFTMGSFYFLGSEWTNPEFLHWAKNDFLLSYSIPSIQFRLLASHYFDGVDAKTTVSTAENPTDLLLIGHNHQTRVLQKEPYWVLSVGTAQDHQRAAFFNFRRNADGWTTDQPITHAEGINVHRLVGDYGLPTVTSEFSKDNNGTVKSNSVCITNNLPFNFYNGRIRFLMEQGCYFVKGGKILSTYEYDNGKKTAVIVKVDIKENSLTELSIKRL